MMTVPSSQSGLQDWIDWLLQQHSEEIDLGLERIRLVAESMALSSPAPFVISVAGTNGKGSSVAMLSSILREAGYQVGAYTSPHVQSFNERIQINGVPVCDSLIVQAFAQIEAARGITKLTYFEFATLAALYIFCASRLDVAILEVGLGGRLDAVNVVDADVALITAIGVDHVEWLGNDRRVIAIEKAGIMRAGKWAVCSDGMPPDTLLEYAEQQAVPLMQLNRDFTVQVGKEGWSIQGVSETFKKNVAKEVGPLPFPALQGAFQLCNAAGVIVALLLQKALPVEPENLSKGLQVARHPGRLDQFQYQGQSWLMDVAHNPQSAVALADYLLDREKKDNVAQNKGYTAIFSVLNDKDALSMIETVAPFVVRWLIVDLQVPRASSIVSLTERLREAGIAESDIYPQKTMSQAVEVAQLDLEHPVLVWGSFFTVAQAYQCLDKVREQGRDVWSAGCG